MWCETTGGGGKRCHRDLSENAVTLRIEFSLGALHQRQHPPSVCYERGRSVSETYASSVSLKQRLPEFALKFRNLL